MSEVPKRPPGAEPPADPSRTTSKLRNLKVLSAERKDRPEPGVGAVAHTVAPRLKSEAENAVLNAISIAREATEEFRRWDVFFKYKLLIIGAWVVLSAITLAVVFPRSEKADNNLGARLIVTTVLDHPVYMVKNEGTRAWRDVVVVVNRHFRAAAAEVEPGHDLTFGPKQLLGENGATAPVNLELTEFEVRTAQGSTKLVEEGQFR